MLRRLARARALKRLEDMFPNPRGARRRHPDRNGLGRVLVTTVVQAAAAWGVAHWQSDSAAPTTRSALIDCGNGRWVSDAGRCR